MKTVLNNENSIYLGSFENEIKNQMFEENIPRMAILQLADADELHMKKFAEFSETNPPQGNDYELIYLEENMQGFSKNATESIYTRFNQNTPRPSSYYGHSVSVSDVILISDFDGNIKPYYCDSFGFKSLDKSFVTEKLKNRFFSEIDIKKEYEMYQNTGIKDKRFSFIDENYSDIFELAQKRGLLEKEEILNAIFDFELLYGGEKNADSITTFNHGLNKVVLQNKLFKLPYEEMNRIVTTSYKNALYDADMHNENLTLENISLIKAGDYVFKDDNFPLYVTEDIIISEDDRILPFPETYKAVDENGEIIEFTVQEIERLKREERVIQNTKLDAELYGIKVEIENGKKIVNQEILDAILKYNQAPVLDNCIFKNVDFDRAESLIKATFSNSLFNECSSKRGNLMHCKFDNCAFNRSVFEDTNLINTDFTNSHFNDCSFAETDLSGANFTKVNMKNSLFFKNTIIADMNFLNATFDNVIIDDVIIAGYNTNFETITFVSDFVSKEVARKQVEEKFKDSLKPQIKYYTKNLGGTGRNEDTLPVIYEDAQTALSAYLEPYKDGKELGIIVNGITTKVSYFDTVDNSNHFLKEESSRSIAGLLEKDSLNVQNDLEIINKALLKNDVENQLYSSFSDLIMKSNTDIINQNSEWGSWWGRVVNRNKPQDYVEIDITGYSKYQEIAFTINLVQDNVVTESKTFTAKTDAQNLRESLGMAYQTAITEFEPFLQSVAGSMELNQRYELYSPFSEHSLEQHYEMLKGAGFEDIPLRKGSSEYSFLANEIHEFYLNSDEAEINSISEIEKELLNDNGKQYRDDIYDYVQSHFFSLSEAEKGKGLELITKIDDNLFSKAENQFLENRKSLSENLRDIMQVLVNNELEESNTISDEMKNVLSIQGFALDNDVVIDSRNKISNEKEGEVMDTHGEENIENHLVNEDGSGIKIEGHKGKWSVIDSKEYGGEKLFLLEHETYGDEAPSLIVDENGIIKMDDVYNGFSDFDENYVEVMFWNSANEAILFGTSSKFPFSNMIEAQNFVNSITVPSACQVSFMVNGETNYHNVQLEIGQHTYDKVDYWEDGTEQYTTGQDISDKEFYCVKVVSTDDKWKGEYHYEFDGLPTRQDVEDAYLNDISMRELDRQEAEFGADGRLAFPHLNDTKEIDWEKLEEPIHLKNNETNIFLLQKNPNTIKDEFQNSYDVYWGTVNKELNVILKTETNNYVASKKFSDDFIEFKAELENFETYSFSTVANDRDIVMDMSIRKKYEELMKTYGYTQVPINGTSMATVAFENGITKETMGFDGWELVGDFLEDLEAKKEKEETKERKETMANTVALKDSEELSVKDQMMKKLEDGIKNTLDSESFADWCKKQGKLYYNNYSINNALLVYFQNNDASFVGGYDYWQTMGRQVRKGAKSIKILAPSFVKEYGAKGSLFALIKKNCSEQFKKDGNLEYANFKLGQTKLSFNMYKNGLFDVKVDNTVKMAHVTAEELRKFLDTSVIGKVPAYYSAISVFDIADTTTDVEHVWLSDGFKKEDLALDENGKSVKVKGKYKVINTEERKAKFDYKLDLTIKEADNEKMQILFDVLKKISGDRGVQVDIKSPSTDEELQGGALGYYNRISNNIVLSDALSQTNSVAVLFHEMAHADMHKDLEALKTEMSAMNEEQITITRHMKEMQAEAVAFMTASNFGIETEHKSFDYIANWSNGRELKELEQSLDVIYKASKKLMQDIEKNLDTKGLTLSLDAKAGELLSKEEVEKFVSSEKAFVINGLRENDIVSKNAIDDLKLSSNEEEQTIIKEQVSISHKINEKLNEINQNIEKLPLATSRQEQTNLQNLIVAGENQMLLLQKQFSDLTTERMDVVKESATKTKEDMKALYQSSPVDAMKKLQENFEEMKNLNTTELSYLATSKFISRTYSKFLGVDNQKFVTSALKQLDNAKAVASKNGCFVEINTCEKWSNESIFESGEVAHPKVVDKVMTEAEKQIREFKEVATSNNEYYPYTKCDLTIFSFKSTESLVKMNTRIDIGDGEQKNLSDHLSQICEKARSKEKKAIHESFTASTKERVKGKQLFAHSEEEIDKEISKKIVSEKKDEIQVDKTMPFDDWKEKINAKIDDLNGEVQEQETEEENSKSKSLERV